MRFVDSGHDTQSDLTIPFPDDKYLKLVEQMSIPPRMEAALEQHVPRVETWTSAHETFQKGNSSRRVENNLSNSSW